MAGRGWQRPNRGASGRVEVAGAPLIRPPPSAQVPLQSPPSGSHRPPRPRLPELAVGGTQPTLPLRRSRPTSARPRHFRDRVPLSTAWHRERQAAVRPREVAKRRQTSTTDDKRKRRSGGVLRRFPRSAKCPGQNPAIWPSILDSETWRAIAPARRRPATLIRSDGVMYRTRRTRRPSRRDLLTGGLAVCGVCGTRPGATGEEATIGELLISYLCDPGGAGPVRAPSPSSSSGG